jgi:hypothetical protein
MLDPRSREGPCRSAVMSMAQGAPAATKARSLYRSRFVLTICYRLQIFKSKIVTRTDTGIELSLALNGGERGFYGIPLAGNYVYFVCFCIFLMLHGIVKNSGELCCIPCRRM